MCHPCWNCSLVRLYQYDDAKNVAAMIKRLEPQEVAAHTASCARALQVGEAWKVCLRLSMK
jgi:hypothetical protein